ncbi:carbohydrate porin [Robbsia andropogonis]|uniref:carbohydrate porin n=1 Tax=Robbsia andropogonis TaxID=28092 RepID=UPI0020A0F579|nr:carbohydrate porin [Robbsia andropogonis]MCP1120209.1 carbohydrate porin [Robbsia andropogonis]MCP1130145.1 carbohydrate porin [Robbsia andropogonis]
MKHITDITHHVKAVVVGIGLSSFAVIATAADPQSSTVQADAADSAPVASAPVAAKSPQDSTKGKRAVKGVFRQTQSDAGDNPPGLASVSPRPPTGAVPPPRKGPLSGIGDALDERGINLGLFFTNGYFTNLTTGVKQGKSVDYATLYMSVNLDLQKLIGIPNTQFHITEAWEPPSHNTGNFSSEVSAGFAPFPATVTTSNLVKLTLSHDLFNKRLHVEYGRMNLIDDFMVATMCAGCYAATPLITVGVPPLDKSVWGARMAYSLSPHTRLGLGVIEDNYALFSQSTGWDWSTRTRKGWVWVGNVMHTTDFSSSRYPLNLEAGIYHDTSPYTDDLRNVDGSSQAVNPFGTAVTHGSGTWGVYGQARKVVWRAADSESPVPRNVALYGGAYITPGPGHAYPIEAFGGAEYGGFIKGNPAAVVGTTVRYIRLSDGRAAFEQQLSAASGFSNAPVQQNTFAFDVHAQYGIAPGVLVNASAQYLLHPNRVGPFAASTGNTRSGWLLGLFLVVDIGRIVGLSR